MSDGGRLIPDSIAIAMNKNISESLKKVAASWPMSGLALEKMAEYAAKSDTIRIYPLDYGTVVRRTSDGLEGMAVGDGSVVTSEGVHLRPQIVASEWESVPETER